VNWTPQSSGVAANLVSVHFTDVNHGWIAGEGGTIIYTQNGGTNWYPPVTNPAEGDVKDVFFINNLKGWAVGSYNSGLYKYEYLVTTDGGLNWSFFDGPYNNNSELQFVNENEGWMVGFSGKIYYSNDGGTTWYQQATETTQYLYGISMADNKNGWAVGNSGALQRTAFGGCYLPRVSLYEDQAFCTGESYRLRADTFEVANATYLWSTGATAGSIYATYPGGKYWVDVWNVCGDKATDTINVIFLPLPVAYAGEDTAICYGDTIQLGASGGASYSWNHVSYLSDPGIPNPLASPPVGNTNFTVMVTDANGCENTDAVLVTVYKIPTSSFSAPANACEGLFEMITYTGNASFAANYAWDFDGGNTHDMGNQSYEVWWDTSGERTISLAVEENGCHSDTTRVTVDINPIPVSEFSVQPRVCGDDTVQIVFEGAGSAEADYEWNFDGGEIISGENEGPYQVNWASGGTKTLSLLVTQDGCISELNEEQIIVAYPFEGEEICLVSVDLDTWRNIVIWEKTENAGIEYYNIYREDSLIGTSGIDDLSVFVDMEANPKRRPYLYRISVVDSCGNESDKSPYHKPLFLQYVSSINGVNLTWSKYEIQGQGIDFSSYTVYRGADSTVLSPIEENIPTEVNYFTDDDPLALEKRYYYRVAGIKSEVCDPANLLGKKVGTGPYSQSMSNIEDNRLQVGINDLRDGINSLMIYPNPFRQQTRITYKLDRPSDVKIEIFNLLGARTADIVNMKQNPGDFSYDLSASDIGVSEGVFYLRFTVNGNATVKKLILTK
jgi:photosystem II stability/assembly factor-like uncharacterized protein